MVTARSRNICGVGYLLQIIVKRYIDIHDGFLCYGGVGVPLADGNGAGVSGRWLGVLLDGILPAVTSPGKIARRGFCRSARVTPEVIFVRPMTGGSLFLTNSYSPVTARK